MSKVIDFYNFIDTIAPFNTQEDWDNSGFLVGDGNAEVKKVILALDVTEDVLKEAENKGANLIITHHPVIFGSLKEFHPSSLAFVAAQKNIAVISAHTCLDIADGGVNDCLAGALELSDIGKCGDELGLLRIGNLKEKMTCLEFVKYVSDKYKDDPYGAIAIPEGASFEDLVALKGDKNIGEKIDILIAKLAEANNLTGIINNAHFNDEAKIGKGDEMVEKLTGLIAIFQKKELDFKNNRAEDDDLIGDAYEYLMRNFATASGKSKGQFYTPAEVSRILAKVINISECKDSNATIYDPACGSGSLLVRAANEAPYSLAIYGQEKDISTAGLAKMNLVLHNKASGEIHSDNTFSDPWYKEDDDDTKLRKELRESGVEYMVTKNTLLRRAAADAKMDDLSDAFKGSTAIAISKDDYVAASKILCKFAKDHDFFKIKCPALDHFTPVRKFYISDLHKIKGYFGNGKLKITRMDDATTQKAIEEELKFKKETMLRKEKFEMDAFSNFSLASGVDKLCGSVLPKASPSNFIVSLFDVNAKRKFS